MRTTHYYQTDPLTVRPWLYILHDVRDIQLISRIHEKHLLSLLSNHPAVILHGARQTGKTTLCAKSSLADGRKYINFDELNNLHLALSDPDALFIGKGRVTVDEAQRAPEVLLAVKRRIDENRKPGEFLITGSANILLMRTVGESLAGRAVVYALPGFVWPELERMSFGGTLSACLSADSLETLVAELPAERRIPKLSLGEAVHRGGYPVPSMHPDPVFRAQWYDGYVQTYLERDLARLSAVENVVEFRRLMGMCAARNGQLLNAAALADGLQISQATARRYLSLLEQSFQILRVPAYAVNRGKRLIKAPKLYWSDTGLASHLAGVFSLGDLLSDRIWGPWLENFVAIHLLVFVALQSPRATVSHWRTSDGREVDFVVEWGRRLLPIEIKASPKPVLSRLSGLNAFLDTYEGVPFGIVLCTCSEPFLLSSRIIALPFEQLLLN